jgi:hypothetical protein
VTHGFSPLDQLHVASVLNHLTLLEESVKKFYFIRTCGGLNLPVDASKFILSLYEDSFGGEEIGEEVVFV